MSKHVPLDKIPHLLKRVKECIDNGNYRFTKHALERKEERYVTLPDILEILYNGFHEKIKDRWNEQFRTWDYSIRGRAVDGEDCRIVVSFNEDNLLIITVMRLNQRVL